MSRVRQTLQQKKGSQLPADAMPENPMKQSKGSSSKAKGRG